MGITDGVFALTRFQMSVTYSSVFDPFNNCAIGTIIKKI